VIGLNVVGQEQTPAVIHRPLGWSPLRGGFRQA
jgi:hypothetical protein